MWILCKMGPLIMLDRKGCHSVFRRIKQFKNKPKLALRLNKLWGSVTVVSLCDPCDGARTNLTCLLFIDLMRTDKALQNLWRMSSVSEKTQANRQHFVWFWGLFPKICCLHKISNTMVFVLLFFLCALKAFMETQCLHFRFPSTRGKQISKSDTSSSYETSRHRFLFLWMYIYKIYVNIYCIMYVHTHIYLFTCMCVCWNSHPHNRWWENVLDFSCLLQSIYLQTVCKVWWFTNMLVCSLERMTGCLWVVWWYCGDQL